MLAVTFLGTSASRPTVERNVSAIAITREGETLLFDCGEGTQRQMMRYGVSFSLNEVFITHFHADHYLGLAGLVRTFALQGRTEPLTVRGPKGLKRVVGHLLFGANERLPFDLELAELDAGERLQRQEYDIVVFGTDHGANSLGFAIEEHERLGRFDPDRARELGIPEGPLWGRLHRGESVTLDDGRTIGPESLVGESRPGRKVVYTGDTRPAKRVVDAAAGADLLIHEATFGDDEADRARETDHSTATEAAQVALAAGVGKLYLTHLSARYSVGFQPLLEQARAVFSDIVVARDGMVVDVEFRER